MQDGQHQVESGAKPLPLHTSCFRNSDFARMRRGNVSSITAHRQFPRHRPSPTITKTENEPTERAWAKSKTPMNLKHRLPAMATLIHRLPARNAGVASLYLRMFRVLKYLPDGRWKAVLERTLEGVRWPEVRFPPSTVKLAPDVKARLVPHVGEFDFSAHIFRTMPYEPEVRSWLVKQSYDVVIEIGANIGFYSVLLARTFPQARIYSFEPAQTAYRRLLENLALNNCKNVVPFGCAVAHVAGFLDFYEPEGHLTNGSLDRPFAEVFGSVTPTKVPSFSGKEVGGLVERGKKMLIKIDAEGLEPQILRSLEPLIISELPDMIIEVVRDVPQQLNQIEFLRAYRLFQLLPEGTVEVERFELTTTRDYALIPRTKTSTVRHVA